MISWKSRIYSLVQVGSSCRASPNSNGVMMGRRKSCSWISFITNQNYKIDNLWVDHSFITSYPNPTLNLHEISQLCGIDLPYWDCIRFFMCLLKLISDKIDKREVRSWVELTIKIAQMYSSRCTYLHLAYRLKYRIHQHLLPSGGLHISASAFCLKLGSDVVWGQKRVNMRWSITYLIKSRINNNGIGNFSQDVVMTSLISSSVLSTPLQSIRLV